MAVGADLPALTVEVALGDEQRAALVQDLSRGGGRSPGAIG